MRGIVTVVSLCLLLALAGFSLFGFLASFEPNDSPGMFLAFRIGYAVIGTACVLGALRIIRNLRAGKNGDGEVR